MPRFQNQAYSSNPPSQYAHLFAVFLTYLVNFRQPSLKHIIFLFLRFTFLEFCLSFWIESTCAQAAERRMVSLEAIGDRSKTSIKIHNLGGNL